MHTTSVFLLLGSRDHYLSSGQLSLRIQDSILQAHGYIRLRIDGLISPARKRHGRDGISDRCYRCYLGYLLSHSHHYHQSINTVFTTVTNHPDHDLHYQSFYYSATINTSTTTTTTLFLYHRHRHHHHHHRHTTTATSSDLCLQVRRLVCSLWTNMGDRAV